MIEVENEREGRITIRGVIVAELMAVIGNGLEGKISVVVVVVSVRDGVGVRAAGMSVVLLVVGVANIKVGALRVVVDGTGVIVVAVSSGGTEVGDGIGGNVVIEAAVVESSIGEVGDESGGNTVVVTSTGNEIIGDAVVLSAGGGATGGVAVSVMD